MQDCVPRGWTEDHQETSGLKQLLPWTPTNFQKDLTSEKLSIIAQLHVYERRTRSTLKSEPQTNSCCVKITSETLLCEEQRTDGFTKFNFLMSWCHFLFEKKCIELKDISLKALLNHFCLAAGSERNLLHIPKVVELEEFLLNDLNILENWNESGKLFVERIQNLKKKHKKSKC